MKRPPIVLPMVASLLTHRLQTLHIFQPGRDVQQSRYRYGRITLRTKLQVKLEFAKTVGLRLCTAQSAEQEIEPCPASPPFCPPDPQSRCVSRVLPKGFRLQEGRTRADSDRRSGLSERQGRKSHTSQQTSATPVPPQKAQPVQPDRIISASRSRTWRRPGRSSKARRQLLLRSRRREERQL